MVLHELLRNAELDADVDVLRDGLCRLRNARRGADSGAINSEYRFRRAALPSLRGDFS
jgi:hypothetical protein